MNRKELIAAMRATAGAPPKPCEVPGWGTVFVKPMTVEQVDLQQQEAKGEGPDRLRFARAAARIVCDEHGELLFDATSEDDLKLLAAQPWETLSKVLGMKDHAITGEGQEEAKNG